MNPCILHPELSHLRRARYVDLAGLGALQGLINLGLDLVGDLPQGQGKSTQHVSVFESHCAEYSQRTRVLFSSSSATDARRRSSA